MPYDVFYGLWDVQNVRYFECRTLGMWYVWVVGSSGCGMFGMCDIRYVGSSECRMFGIWDVQGCGMFGMWGVGCGMWDVSWDMECWFTKCLIEMEV